VSELARNAVLLVGAYLAYRLTRGAADDPAGTAAAFDNARAIIALERELGLFVEPAVQRWAIRTGVSDALAWAYVNTQTTVTVGALAYVFLRDRARFRRTRDVLLGSFALACAGYALLPTAPPRFLPEWGFTDPVAALERVDALYNPYAAVPSMHVGFAIVVAVPLARLARRRAVAAAWAAYPLLVTLVIVATANHFVLDAVLGAATVALAAAAARLVRRPAAQPVPA
jgi:hypothetical protein